MFYLLLLPVTIDSNFPKKEIKNIFGKLMFQITKWNFVKRKNLNEFEYSFFYFFLITSYFESEKIDSKNKLKWN